MCVLCFLMSGQSLHNMKGNCRGEHIPVRPSTLPSGASEAPFPNMQHKLHRCSRGGVKVDLVLVSAPQSGLD